jgi:23S rRNA (adenine1618-N6)-methyltransferase
MKDGVVDMPDGERGVELAFRIRVIGLAREIEVLWLRGRDRVLWESFCGMVHGKFKQTGS